MGGAACAGRRGSGLGTLTFTVETKRANLAAVLEILRQVLREPTLPADEFEVMKNAELASLEQADPSRSALAFNQHPSPAFTSTPADDVRYVPTIDEQIERLKKRTIEQVRTLYNEYLGAAHGELAIVGDFEPSEVLPLLDQTLGLEGRASRTPGSSGRISPSLKPERETIETPDKENAVYLAAPSHARSRTTTPDYPALVVGNFILGGGSLSSRHRRPPPAEGGPLLRRGVRSSPPARSTPRATLTGHGDLQPDEPRRRSSPASTKRSPACSRTA